MRFLKVGKGRQYIAKIKKDYLNHPNIYFLQVLTKYYNRYENLELKNIIKKEFSGRYKYSYPASLYHWNIIHNFLRKKLWTNSTKENYYQNNISQKNKSSKKTKIPQQYPFDIFDSIHILLPNKKYLIDGVFQVTEKRSRRLFLQQNKDKKFLEHFDEKGNLQQYRVKNIYRIDNKNREIKKHLEKIQIIYDYFDTDVAKSILPKSQYHLKILENKTGNYYRYQKLYGEKKKMKDMKKDELRQIFPVPFPSVMNYYSKRYSIDPRLILSILKAESSFVETAISHSGALGLGQIMPRTGREIYNKSQVRYFSEMDLINPNQNIHFAYRYFSWLMKKYRGNYLQAICAYNGGPTSVDRWLKKYDFKNDLQFALTISFWQTYNYAQKVLRYYAYYLELYP